MRGLKIFYSLRDRAAALSFLCIALIGLFFIRPAGSFRLYSDIDDRCYLKFAGQWVGEAVNGCIGGNYPPGAGFFWLPASVAAKITTLVSDLPFEVIGPLFIGIFMFLYWACALRIFVGVRDASRIGSVWLSLALFLGTPALYYATHRVTMVHAVEVFLAVGIYCSVVRKNFLALTVSAIGMTALRLNDFPALLLVVAAAWQPEAFSIPDKWVKRLRVSCVILGTTFLIWVGWVALVRGYHSIKFTQMMARFTWDRLSAVFVGKDWGLLFTGFFYCLAFAYGCIRLSRMDRIRQACVAWLGIEFVILIGWRGNGSDFGYRYLVGASAAAWLILDPVLRTVRLRHWRWPILASAVLNVWMLWLYKIFPEMSPMLTSGKFWSVPDFIPHALTATAKMESFAEPWMYSLPGTLWATRENIYHPASLYELEKLSGIPLGFLEGVVYLLLICLLGMLFAAVFRLIGKRTR